jgi:hypothetical protein
VGDPGAKAMLARRRLRQAGVTFGNLTPLADFSLKYCTEGQKLKNKEEVTKFYTVCKVKF